MYISKLFDFFRENNFILLKIDCNADQGSIWFSEKNDPEFIGFKMHSKSRGDNTIITWFSKTTDEHSNLRVYFDQHKDVLVISHLNTKTQDSKDTQIHEFSELSDEAIFFQRSTVEDFDALLPEHVPFILELSKKVTTFSKGMIDANKTCSS